ncbi:MAG: hypothetical protein GY820_10405 [Gammaproteobacteria bacterium]|nr:hypothetical protein [Gammaproteobacteria bacterium]
MKPSIQSNVKSVAQNSVAIPVEVAAVSLEVLADSSDLVLGAVRGALPVLKEILPSVKKLASSGALFSYGCFVSDISEEDARKKYEEATIASVFDNIQAASLKAGQATGKMFKED